MFVRSLALFIHVGGVLLLFAALALEKWCLELLRQPGPPAQRSRFTAMLTAVQRQSLIAVGLILVSGGYLAARVGVFGLAWVRVSLGAMVLMAIVGGPVARSAMRALRLGQDAPQPLLYASLRIRIAVALAIVYLMIAKPDLGPSLLLIAVAFVLGVASTVTAGRVHPSPVVSEASPH